jgi:hypothetical protein
MLKPDWSTVRVSVQHPCDTAGCKRNAKAYHMYCATCLQVITDKVFRIARYKAI